VPETTDELWAVRRLRGKRALWRTFRWIYLLGGAAAIVAGQVGYRRALTHFGNSFDTAPTVSHFEVSLAIMLAVQLMHWLLINILGVMGIVLSLAHWRGRPKDILLLSIYERQLHGPSGED